MLSDSSPGESGLGAKCFLTKVCCHFDIEMFLILLRIIIRKILKLHLRFYVAAGENFYPIFCLRTVTYSKEK